MNLRSNTIISLNHAASVLCVSQELNSDLISVLRDACQVCTTCHMNINSFGMPPEQSMQRNWPSMYLFCHEANGHMEEIAFDMWVWAYMCICMFRATLMLIITSTTNSKPSNVQGCQDAAKNKISLSNQMQWYQGPETSNGSQNLGRIRKDKEKRYFGNQYYTTQLQSWETDTSHETSNAVHCNR